MLRIERKTKLTADDAMLRAIHFFGPDGLGLDITSRAPGSVTLEGGGGGIIVTVSAEESGTSVEVQSREWDYQAKEFLAKLGG